MADLPVRLPTLTMLRRLLRRRRVPYWQTERWKRRNARFKQLPRARRCAACLTTRRLVTHHLAYPLIRGTEFNWQLVRVCWHHHVRIHRLSRWLFGGQTKGLWVTSGIVIGLGKLNQALSPRARRDALDARWRA